MGKKASSSESSSEDENLAKFREVAVSFESIKESNKADKNGSSKAMSNRCMGQVDENDEDDPNNIIKVTPEFQHFVAAKLSQKLDSLIELVPSPLLTKKEKETEDVEKGFKLTKDINLVLNETTSSKPIETPRKKTKKKKKHKRKEQNSSDSSSDSDMDMLKEAAIDSSEIFKTTSIVEHQKRYGAI